MYPKGVPKQAIWLLIGAVMLVCTAFLRKPDGVYAMLENWVFWLIVVPSFTALMASPLKYRDMAFDLKLPYYLGMFVGLLFLLGKFRYWR